MTVTVTMLQTRKGEDGNLWTVGNSYSATDAFAQLLIAANLATGTLPALTPNFPTAAEAAALRASVSGAGISGGTNLAWVSGTAYTAGQNVITPSGRLVVCRTTHTAGSVYDASKWIYPGGGGKSVVDFSVLANGDDASGVLEPVCGILGWTGTTGTGGALGTGYWGISNGRYTGVGATPGATVSYLQLALPDVNDKIQHIWCVYEANAGFGTGVTLVAPSSDRSNGSGMTGSGIHSGIAGDYPGAGQGVVSLGTYPDGLTAVAAVGIAMIPANGQPNPINRLMRIDITADQTTGLQQSFINGVLYAQRIDLTGLQTYTSRFGHMELLNPLNKAIEFGISGQLPEWSRDGSRRTTKMVGNEFYVAGSFGSTAVALQSIFGVTYDDYGYVELAWTPFFNYGGAGEIWVGFSATAGVAPTDYQIVSRGPILARVPVRIFRGPNTAGTVENLQVWCRVTSGTASIEGGGTVGLGSGVSWRPARS